MKRQTVKQSEAQKAKEIGTKERTLGSSEAKQGETTTEQPPPILKKLPPKSWSDLLKDPNTQTQNQTRSHLHNQPQTNGQVPHSFTTLADLLARYDPETQTTALLLQPRGLVNRGNMCFMNAILQVLVHCKPFYCLFDRIGTSVRQKLGQSKTPLTDAMIMFLREFRLLPRTNGVAPSEEVSAASEDIGEAFAPDHVYRSMRGNPRFNSMQRGHQEDAEEFLGFLLDGLHEEFVAAMREQSGPLRPDSRTDDWASSTAGSDTGAAEEWLEVGRRQKTAHTRTATVVESPITRIFGGKLRSVLRIGGAKDSITLEPYLPLQLDIGSPAVVNIVDALQQIPEPEVLSEDWTNGKGIKVTATKQVFIESLPPVLILHLKRFLYDNVGGTQKSWKQIGYPLELTVPDSALAPGRRATIRATYKLFGVVYHHGLSASGGHYTVDVLRQDAKSWIHLDDTNIEPVEQEEVAVQDLDHMDPGLTKPKLAYILFYVRKQEM